MASCSSSSTSTSSALSDWALLLEVGGSTAQALGKAEIRQLGKACEVCKAIGVKATARLIAEADNEP
eukprot:1550776-Lingulodinium_polyedra.AAC.1